MSARCSKVKPHWHYPKEVIGWNVSPPFWSAKQMSFRISIVPIRSFFFYICFYSSILFICWTTAGWTFDKIYCNVACLFFTSTRPSSNFALYLFNHFSIPIMHFSSFITIIFSIIFSIWTTLFTMIAKPFPTSLGTILSSSHYVKSGSGLVKSLSSGCLSVRVSTISGRYW